MKEHRVSEDVGPACRASTTELIQAFEDAVQHSLMTQAGAAERDVAALREELAQLSRRFVTLDRQLLAQMHRGQQLREMSGVVESAGDELETMLAVPGVQAVEVHGQTLHVLTHPMQIVWQDQPHELGRYRIVLDLDGDLHIESIDKLGPKPGWDHPHVQDGRPCFGNAREGVLKLIAEYELALAVQVTVGFLQTYLPDSAYCAIERWPLAHADG